MDRGDEALSNDQLLQVLVYIAETASHQAQAAEIGDGKFDLLVDFAGFGRRQTNPKLGTWCFGFADSGAYLRCSEGFHPDIFTPLSWNARSLHPFEYTHRVSCPVARNI